MQRGGKADVITTVVFMALAFIAAVCLFFVSDRVYALGFAGVAILLRIVQYILRFFK